jgi:hypothetical protein
VPIYVSITLRPAQARAQARGNLVALMTVPLPVRVPHPVGLEYTITAMTCVFSRRRVVCQAAIWYSWVSPPRTCFRRIRCSVRLIGSGG